MQTHPIKEIVARILAIFRKKEPAQPCEVVEEELVAMPFSPAPTRICEKYKKKGAK